MTAFRAGHISAPGQIRTADTRFRSPWRCPRKGVAPGAEGAGHAVIGACCTAGCHQGVTKRRPPCLLDGKGAQRPRQSGAWSLLRSSGGEPTVEAVVGRCGSAMVDASFKGEAHEW